MRVVLLLLVLLCAPSLAWGQAVSTANKEQAKQLFARGVERMKVDDWSGALGLLEQAYAVAPYSVILFNMGIALEKLDRPADALTTMEKVLDAPGNLRPVRLERAKRTFADMSKRVGKLTVTVDQSGASVRVDGRPVGTTPLSEPLRLDAGTRYVEVFKKGHEPHRRAIELAGGATEQLAVTLNATDKPYAEIWVRTDLPDAEVWIDGKRVGTTPVEQSIVVEAGEHRVELKRFGYEPARDLVEVSAGATANVRLEPREERSVIAKHGGFVELENDAPNDLVLTIDGARHGPYVERVALAPGAHDIKVERAGFVATTLRVTVESGVTNTREVLLDPTPETVADHNSDVSLFRGLGWTFTGVGAAALIGGAVFVAWNENDISDREEAFFPKLEPGGACEPGSAALGANEQACREEAVGVDDARGRRPLSAAFFVGGGALLVTGVVLLIVGPDADKYAPDVNAGDELAIAPLLSPFMLGVHGTF